MNQDLCIGGIVVGVLRTGEGTLLAVEPLLGGPGDKACVRVVEWRRDNRNPVTVAEGDHVFWDDGDDVIWTPIDFRRAGGPPTHDVRIPKVTPPARA